MITLLAPSSNASVVLGSPDTACHPVWSRAGRVAVLALVLVMPFERPLATVAGVSLVLTTVEVVIAVALLVALLSWFDGSRHFVWRTPITWPALALAGVFVATAAAAPSFAGNALRFAGRFVAAGLIFLLVVNAVRTIATARLVVALFLGLAALVGGVAVLEAAESPIVLRELTAFRPGFHVVGGQLRATSTLGYPTIASMYLEVAFGLGLWLFVEAAEQRAKTRWTIAFTALLLIGAGIIATFTRAGLAALAASLALVAGLRMVRTRRFDRAHLALAVLAVALAGLVILSRSPARLLTRLSTEGSQAWYGARYHVPEALRFVPGGRYRVPVAIDNTGRITWRSDETPPFSLSYHWVVAGSRRVVEFNGRRTPFAAPVAPGNQAALHALVVAPPIPGWYDLVWDVVHEHRAWLSTEGVPAARTAVRVEGPLVMASGDAMPELPAAAIRPDRLALWRTALQMAQARPLTGIGPDNFRLAYGPYLGLATWDTRVHANNLYLETLAGAGVPGLVSLLWLVTAAFLALWRRWRTSTPSYATGSAAMVAVWLIVAGHGLVDTFLAFTPTYVAFAVAAGLAFSPAMTATLHAHANSV
ncbi:MAG: O-antigen ligase family protein [Acidobacteria bacterium]|nr:O-antigen ligase family protein [Acidobacteriota bacterium]